jgi:hypothetical protein
VKIGLDFDRVLFDTDSFNEYLKGEVKDLKHVDSSPYNEHGVYSPKIHAELCGIDVEDIYEKMTDLEKFLDSDISVLESFDHEFVIVTRGESEFQKRKVEGSGANKYVEDVIVVEKGSKDVVGIDFLIDDRKKELEQANLPGFEFNRQKHDLKQAIEEAERHET